MKQSLLLLLLCISSFTLVAQQSDEEKIRALLARQVNDWNDGNIDKFMVGYWNSDSLMFIGKSGITYGYQQTLANYKRGYSDTAKMGKLRFDILQVKRISRHSFFVVGKWFLKRSVGDIGGHYSLLFRRIKGKWVIVADHSS